MNPSAHRNPAAHQPRPPGRRLLAALFDCLRDDRGSSMAEYALVTFVTVPLVLILFHPDNGLYQAAREQFDLTITLLLFPGP